MIPIVPLLDQIAAIQYSPYSGGAKNQASHQAMSKKASDIVAVGLMIAFLASSVVALSVSGNFGHDPHVADPVTGNTIPLSLRGIGTLYLTQTEWDSVAPYWNTQHAIIVLLAVFLAARLIIEGYQSFMQEWRRR